LLDDPPSSDKPKEEINDGAVHPDEVTVFDNDDEIREFLEEIVREKDNQRSIIHEETDDPERKCYIDSCKFFHKGKNRIFCKFHTAIGYMCINLHK